MTKLDRFVQKRRINVAKRFLTREAHVLDLGCADGALFRHAPSITGIGIDPTLHSEVVLPNARLLPGMFPDAVPDESRFDAITMLAVLEHLPPAVQKKLDFDCSRVLKPQGKMIITVPSPQTDVLLTVLKNLKLIHGMSLEEHYGYDVRQTPKLFESFGIVAAKRFQLGLNNLFVFAKREQPAVGC